MSIKYGYNIDLNSDSTAAKVVKLVGSDKKVLEFGCSYGYMTKVLIDTFNCSVVGVEIDSEAAKEAMKTCGKVIVGNAETINYESELNLQSFDVITFADVLEHLSNPQETLKTMHEYLKDDGYIVASFPNISYLPVTLELMSGEFNYRPLGILDDTHLRFFTLKTIYELFESSGYSICSVQRTKVPVIQSEFRIDINNFDHNIIEHIKLNNNEWDTYQFIIKAFKNNDNTRINMLTEELKELKIKLGDMEYKGKENQELKTYVEKLEKDNSEITQYCRKLESDIKELTKHCRKLEADNEDVTEYGRRLEVDINELTKPDKRKWWK